MPSPFELLLFSTQPDLIRAAVAAGVSGIIVDWEHLGKEKRQQGYDTQVNHDTLADLERARCATAATLICRINHHPGATEREIENAIAAGADEILVPMVRTPGELERIFEQVQGRCKVGILIETTAAVQNAAQLAQFPLRRVYVGLNDLSIERRTPSLFTAVADGTVAALRACFQAPFGFAGLTLPELGAPIPCRLLMGEMARLGCHFSFLRRSFHRDIRGKDLQVEVPRIRQAIADLHLRPVEQVEQDRADLQRAIAALEQETA